MYFFCIFCIYIFCKAFRIICKPIKTLYYSWGVLTTAIEYSSLYVCLSVCVCLTMHTITQKHNGSINLKLEDVVVCGNCLDYSDSGHCPIKIKSRGNKYSPFITTQTREVF